MVEYLSSIFNIVGVDIEDLISTWKEKENGVYLQGDGNQLPFAPDSFDVVFFFGLIGLGLYPNNPISIVEEMNYTHPKGCGIFNLDV